MKKITKELLTEILENTIPINRKRLNYNLHSSLEDPYQRILNCLLPGTYLRPHRHTLPEKSESILILKGRVMVIEFETDGKINDFLELNSELGNYGIDLMPGIYHTLIPLTESIIFEAKQGPFSPINFLDLAPWAPAEVSDGTLEYQKRLLEEIYSR
jgi:cupin fold WbuC family metalloprotein